MTTLRLMLCLKNDVPSGWEHKIRSTGGLYSSTTTQDQPVTCPLGFETPTLKSAGGMRNHYDRYLYGTP